MTTVLFQHAFPEVIMNRLVPLAMVDVRAESFPRVATGQRSEQYSVVILLVMGVI
jgi:hypothetical protein